MTTRTTKVQLPCPGCGTFNKIDTADVAVLTGPAQAAHGTLRAVCAKCGSFIFHDLLSSHQTMWLVGLGARSYIVNPHVDTLPGAGPMTATEAAEHRADILTATPETIWAELDEATS